jgi:hypothetical protein
MEMTDKKWLGINQPRPLVLNSGHTLELHFNDKGELTEAVIHSLARRENRTYQIAPARKEFRK